MSDKEQCESKRLKIKQESKESMPLVKLPRQSCMNAIVQTKKRCRQLRSTYEKHRRACNRITR